MPEPFQKGNSAEYIANYERIFRPGVKPKGWTFCGGCGSLTTPVQVPEGWVCTVCGDVRVSRKEVA
jgi:hypothetical protein